MRHIILQFLQSNFIFIAVFLLFFSLIIRNNKNIRILTYIGLALSTVYLFLVFLYKKGIGYAPLYYWSIGVIYEVLELTQKVLNTLYANTSFIIRIIEVIMTFSINWSLVDLMLGSKLSISYYILNLIKFIQTINVYIKKIFQTFKNTIYNLILIPHKLFVYRC